MKSDPLLMEVLVALGAGRVAFGAIHADGEVVHGIAEKSGAITINPAASVVDTAVHELLHRLRPAWSERSVRSRTAKIMRGLTDAEIDKFYELLLVQARRRRLPVRIEVE